MLTFFKLLLSERDNTTPCVVRFTGFSAFIVGCMLQIYAVCFQHAEFSIVSFFGGVSSLLTAVAAGTLIKKNTEQPPA